MIQRTSSMWMVLLVAVFGLAACGGDAGEATSEAVAQTASAENPCATADDATSDDATSNDAAGMQELPEGVTMAMVDEGKALFGGIAICQTCHNADGTGIPNLGADLTDDEWEHADGSYASIVKTVMDGVSADASSSGVPMPPKGGSAISDDQAKAVAAYVWTLSK